ncbi:MAG: FAD-dependent oxidoreductase [Fimbriimonadaceae bacterium]|nr:FAD-dependent oxidoreductase [Fimbriimonadaceae bacterium]
MSEAAERAPQTFDLVVVGGTPGGIMAGIAAARLGRSVVILERTAHLGGLPANGLGATDISTRGCGGGLFRQFVNRVRQHYVDTYGATSPQVADCSDGYHFEPHVAEQVLLAMVAEQPGITVRLRRQFDALPANVTVVERRLTALRVTARDSGEVESYQGGVFVDATYEGDLAAAAGCRFSTRREGHAEFLEPLAGRVYKRWGTAPTELGEGSTLQGDDTIQAYNYRLCLTADPSRRVPLAQPPGYDRSEYAGLADDVRLGRWTGLKGGPAVGLERVVNSVKLPNGKTDSNNQHHAFISTDLPEENYPWPTADWAWRDRFAARLRHYTLGLLWFAQHDDALPAEFRAAAARWGLTGDEYADNGHFPRQVYVREGRRIQGEYQFTAHDALPVVGGRPPVHATSITASHYAIDSHAHRKREPDRVHLDGFLSHPTKPYTVPYGVIVPADVDGLLTPVPVSATHLGFGTLRMEPCWMAMGEAAGAAAALSLAAGCAPRAVKLLDLQRELLRRGAVLLYYQDAQPGEPHYEALQLLGLRGLVAGWKANLAAPLAAAEAAQLGVPLGTPRGAALDRAADGLRE